MTLGFIGAGKMGAALLAGLQRAGFGRAEDVVIHDIDPGAMERIAAGWPGLRTAASGRQVFAEAETVLLCVKPDVVRPTLEQGADGGQDRLMVSIAAGISLSQLENWSGGTHRVIRVMPNSPAFVGQAASAFSLGSRATAEDAARVEELFGCVGRAFRVAEGQLDAVTGLSGSGPAYVYLVIEALTDGGVLEGLPRALAEQLAVQTVAGAAEMVRLGGKHPAALRDEVTSPGGTTIAALATLEEKGLRSALIEAVRTASRRSRELRG